MIGVAARKQRHFGIKLFANIKGLWLTLNENEPNLFANSLQTSIRTHISCKYVHHNVNFLKRRAWRVSFNVSK